VLLVTLVSLVAARALLVRGGAACRIVRQGLVGPRPRLVVGIVVGAVPEKKLFGDWFER
jgi:hypothetical protein